MIQDIYPHKLENAFRPGMQIREESAVFLFRGSDVVLAEKDGALALPTLGEILAALPERMRTDDDLLSVGQSDGADAPEAAQQSGRADAPEAARQSAEMEDPAVFQYAFSIDAQDMWFCRREEEWTGAIALCAETALTDGSSAAPAGETAPAVSGTNTALTDGSSAAPAGETAPAASGTNTARPDGRPDGGETTLCLINIRSLRGDARCGNETMYALYTAWHLHTWYLDNRFCGRCGAPTRSAADERALDCSCCGNRIYPRINPAVIVGVTSGDRLLITRYADRPLAVDALVAGFTEIGETFEETVAREVMEEAGLRVKNIRYYKSQPWGTASDILAGYYCDVDGDDTVHIDAHELRSAVWVPRGEIKGQPDQLSLTNEMMLTFRDGKEPR